MTEFHIVDNMNFDASTVSMIEPSSFLTTFNTTINNGITKDVTNNGMASVAQSNDAQINKAKQFLCAESSNGDTFNKNTVMAKININFITTGFSKIY